VFYFWWNSLARQDDTNINIEIKYAYLLIWSKNSLELFTAFHNDIFQFVANTQTCLRIIAVALTRS